MRCAPILSTATAATPKAAESGDSRPEASLPGRCTARRHAGGAPVARGRRIGGAPCGAGRLKPAAAPPWLGRDGRLSDAPGGDEGIRHDRPSALHLPASGRGVMSGRREGSGWRRRMMPAPQGVGGMGAPSLTTATAAAPERAEVRNRGAWMLSGPEAVSEATPRRALAVRQVGRSLEPARTGGGASRRAPACVSDSTWPPKREATASAWPRAVCASCECRVCGRSRLRSAAQHYRCAGHAGAANGARSSQPCCDDCRASRRGCAHRIARSRCARLLPNAMLTPRQPSAVAINRSEDAMATLPPGSAAAQQRRPRVDLVVGEPYRCGRRAAGSRGRVSGRAGRAVDLDGGRCQ